MPTSRTILGLFTEEFFLIIRVDTVTQRQVDEDAKISN